MKRLLIFIALLFLLTALKRGEPVAILTCKSTSGRTLFYAELPECSYLDSATFSIDGFKNQFTQSDVSGIIFDPENKVFTIYLETNNSVAKDYKFLQFWALPNTFKKTKSENGPGIQFHNVYEFKAKIYGTEPRKGFATNTKVIELSCTLDYEL